jgi:hypothetical protein
MRADEQIADFDSATGMLRVLGEYLRGRDAPLLARYPGAAEPFVAALLGAANRLPRRLQEKAYAASGWAEALPADRMGEVRADELAEWVVGRYPRRRYPAVFVGSSNGAMTHLAAALGACWLPQTLLIPVRRRGGHPDRPAEALRTHRDAGRALMRANPDLELHHMHDANQDRLMVAAPDRLLVENFLLVEPWWTLRTGSVPLWTVFNTEPSRQALLRHLDQADPYDEIRLILFSHGVESVGLASIDDWSRVLDRARKIGVFTGVAARAYPRDFAVFARAHRELARTRHRVPVPARPLDVADVEEFLEKGGDVGWSA